MQAIPVNASVKVLGVDYPVQSVTLNKRIGALTSGTAQIQLQGGKKGQSITGEELAELSSLFKETILNKTDVTPNVSVELLDQLSFEGILVGSQGNVDAAGSAVFNISFVEPNIMLNSMNFNCYPSDLPPATQTGPVETRHPFAGVSEISGSVAVRIQSLYKVAVRSVMDEGTFVDKIFKQQREVNKELESVFNRVMNLSSSETNPEWLVSADAVLSSQVNDELCYNLFSSNRNLWQTLMAIAHKFNLLYVGDFETGGYFRQLDLEGSGTDLTGPPITARNLIIGRNGQQAIGQVSAYAPEKQNSHDPGTVTGNDRSLDRELLAAYPPDNPSPKNGKVVTTTAPSWFTVAREVAERDVSHLKLNPKEDSDVDEIAKEMRRTQEYRKNKQKNRDALQKWCKERYFLLRSRNIRATVRRPFTTEEYPLGEPAKVNNGIEGVLSSVQHEVKVSGDSGSASTTYGIAYVGATS